MKKLVCNYSVVRFLPYPETEEFVNVGILATCPQAGWMDYRMETRKFKRVHDFFPELDMQLFKAGRQRLLTELERLTAESKQADTNKLAADAQRDYAAGIFSEITRPREEIFRFGAPGTLLTDDPAKDLDKLYQHYVERHFAQQSEYQETIMKERITEVLRTNNLQSRYHEQRLGNDEYHVTIPFVEVTDDLDCHHARALKPLNLAQAEATKIRTHGDAWKAKMDRLRKMEQIPQQILFAFRLPKQADAKRTDAAAEICEMLKTEAFGVENYDDTDAVLSFAS